MAENSESISYIRKKEINHVVYNTILHFTRSGSLEELLKKITEEALYDCTIDFPGNVML